MNHEVHAAALRAAARLAFSVAFVAGCSNGAADETQSVDSNLDKATNDNGNAANTDPQPPPLTPAEIACKEVLTSAFANYEWQENGFPISHEATECCLDTAMSFWGHNSEFRNMCCGSYDASEGPKQGQISNMACTPWGPPVPPSMNRKRSLRAVA